jgi:gluconokinase
MPNIPGLRSPYAKVGRLVYFGRVLDKIRLHAEGKLPAEYVANIGDTKPGMFDTRCCGFLRVAYEDIRRRTLEGGGDEEILKWVEDRGGRRSDEECHVWNCFLMKRGWHDEPGNVQRLKTRIKESGLEGKPIETFFDYIDFDEGRDPVAARSWEKV